VIPLAPLNHPLSAPPAQQGYNPDTGQILDPATYALWQKGETKRRKDELQKQRIVSVAEAYLDAQRAIQDWVDDETNKPLVVKGDIKTIRMCSVLQELLQRYAGYGPVMQEKLWKRVLFLVDNRQKFFKAFG
jgi:hypothetical protein